MQPTWARPMQSAQWPLQCYDMGQFYLDQGNITESPSEEDFAEGINTTYIEAYLDSKE